MQKSKFFVIFLLAGAFLLAAAAFAITGTLANEGKAIPPNWCIEHGYIIGQYEGDVLVCRYCG